MAFYNTYRGLQQCSCGHQPTAHMAEFRPNGWNISACSLCQCTEYEPTLDEGRNRTCRGHVVIGSNDVPVFADRDIIIVHSGDSVMIQSTLSLQKVAQSPASVHRN